MYYRSLRTARELPYQRYGLLGSLLVGIDGRSDITHTIHLKVLLEVRTYQGVFAITVGCFCLTFLCTSGPLTLDYLLGTLKL